MARTRKAASVPAANPAAPRPGAPLAPALLLVLYVALALVAVTRHEPWRDEADFWLAARDMPLLDILARGGYVGTPALWTLLLAPFARLGLPCETLGLVNLAFGAGAAALLLFAAPFPLALRALLAFSHFFFYEYPVVARSYALGTLLAFGWAALDACRPARPLARGIVLALLFQCSVHAMAIAAPLLALELAGAWRGRGTLGPRERAGVAVAAVGAVLAVLQILPPPDGQLQGSGVPGGAAWIPIAITGGLLPSLEEQPVFQWAAAALLALVAISLARRPRALVALLGALALLLALFTLKYPGSLRHWGHVLVAVVVALWMAGGVRAWVAWPLGAALAWSAIFGARNWDRDLRYPFSESRAMARWLVDQRLDRSPVVAWPAPQGSAVLAHLPKRRFWYPGIRDSGSYMRWDRRYEEGMAIADDELLRRALEAYPGRDDVLLLTNRPIPGAEAAGFERLHVAAGEAMMYDERYVLYRRGPRDMK